MNEPAGQHDPVAGAVAARPKAVAPRPGRFGLWLILSLPLVVVAGLFVLMVLTQRPLPAPDWLVTRIEARANAAFADAVRLRLSGGADLVLDDRLVPRVRLLGVEVLRPSGLPLAVLPEVRTSLHLAPLLRGVVQPRTIRIRGAGLALRRTPEGALDLALGGALALSGVRLDGATAALAALKAAFATPALAGLERIEAEALEIRLDDARLNRVWWVSAGRLSLTQTEAALALRLGFDVGEKGTVPSSVALSLETRKDTPETRLGVTVTAVPARDLALQSPALAWLSPLEAPISGSLRSGIDATGRVGRLSATLEIGAGALVPVPGAVPAPFEGGRVVLSYDPEVAQMTVSELAVDSRALRLRASGTGSLRSVTAGLPEVLLAQVAISDLKIDPEGLFASPVVFSQGAADLRLRFDPFELDLGQVQLIEGGQRISARGQVGADAAGWRAALDLGIDRIAQDRLLRLWPVRVVPRTREWLADNVATGELRDVKAALRLAPGAEPRLALNYAFEGAEVRIIKTLPPVLDGAGFATIEGTRHTLTVERGHVTAPAGGGINVAGTEMIVPDIREKPARTEVRLHTVSTIPAALSLLDQPPFEFLAKAGYPTDLAEGRAEAVSVLNFRLAKKLRPEDVDYTVAARLLGVRSDRVVPGRLLEAPELTLAASRAGLDLSGAGQLSGVPFSARWVQKFGAENRGRSRLEARVDLSPETLAAFGIRLPEGLISGQSRGQIALDLTKGAAPRFALRSDLEGLGIAIRELGWRKAAQTRGDLAISGRLGLPPAIEALELSAPGLALKGAMTLAADGGLELARLSDLRLGNWFAGSVDLRGQGKGRTPQVTITGGWADMRRMPAGQGASGGGGAPIRLALDRVTVSDNLSLTGVAGELALGGGLSGRIVGRVNGTAPVAVTMLPAGTTGGRAFRITAEDAGAVLAAAGVFSRARGGTLDLTLVPAAAARSYDGRLGIKNLRVRDAPVLAAMLSAASGIGLLEQLNGEGLLFTTVEGDFRTTPEAVTVRSGSAVGASLGVSMAGRYLPGSGQIDMEGVVSPIYLINGIGQLISRRGEGLFGFTYRLAGSAKAPQISINPLSILTPGMFREIFRRAPPKAE
ncbi:hypothetical protein CCR83_13525 [Rhodobacter veldkampii DSM 11550]|uniref:Uncharacterized protein n=1 Tax=Phaeovulum veldkampii DSM 11550 TaxID=1185920 RepID=A0A2T4JKU1_9RHOB|nr:hypothetical protein [Phaeovulum veldkampii]MBK5947437.1 hypothetical protein [Phaeovulum veldkampii DSM 11550]PTE18521.1 hypothetical protein C5F46_03895 [Phaeovulum veldkampii DSM 11550]TDQ59198.1 AsmA-like protein [Phaeovulum veldkampii DSM 11550]